MIIIDDDDDDDDDKYDDDNDDYDDDDDGATGNEDPSRPSWAMHAVLISGDVLYPKPDTLLFRINFRPLIKSNI